MTAQDKHTAIAILDQHGLRSLPLGLLGRLPVRYVCRYLSEASHADDFVSGRIFNSTLECCRRTESKERRDEDEGSLTYLTDTTTGGPTDPEFMTVAKRAGIGIAADHITLSDILSTSVMRDAFVLCATEIESRGLRKSGATAYESTNLFPRGLFVGLSAAAHAQQPFSLGLVGPVQYRTRVYQGLDPHPGVPEDPYASEKEVRMLWEMGSADGLLEPCLSELPRARHFCECIA
jgi:hypothetical protein